MDKKESGLYLSSSRAVGITDAQYNFDYGTKRSGFSVPDEQAFGYDLTVRFFDKGGPLLRNRQGNCCCKKGFDHSLVMLPRERRLRRWRDDDVAGDEFDHFFRNRIRGNINR